MGDAEIPSLYYDLLKVPIVLLVLTLRCFDFFGE
jgi:hypothetical protein